MLFNFLADILLLWCLFFKRTQMETPLLCAEEGFHNANFEMMQKGQATVSYLYYVLPL